ncbi:MAG: hypothetical protein ACREUT_20370 [Steroidobacteraceae bacterium]
MFDLRPRPAPLPRGASMDSLLFSRAEMVRALRRAADEIEAGALRARRVSFRQVAGTDEVAIFELQLEAAVSG